MLLFQLGLLLALLPVCSFAPGFFFVRKLRWNPLEKLCGSIGLSLILLYLVCWTIYCLGPRGNSMPVHPAPYIVIAAICVALAGICGKDIVRLVRIPTVQRALAGFGFLLLWTALLMAMIRNYSGGAWFADWLEHFQRTLFFLQHFPAETPIFPGYAVPARPPMMNVLAAFYLALTTDRFELFQAVFAFLNLLLFLPCYLMMPALGKRAKRRTWLLVLLFASSPLLMQNITYSWTKAGAAFFVVLAIWLYLAGWRKRDSLRTTAAFVALAAGLLVHYSAGPYVVILVLHYFFRVFPHRADRWRELATIATICTVLLGTWLVWSLAVYGSEMTFASNSTVTLSKDYKGNTVEKVMSNLFDSVVPAIVREPSLLTANADQRTSSAVRDWFFIFYQVNVIFGMGLIGGPVAVWLAIREVRRRREQKKLPKPPERSKKAAAKTPPPAVVIGATPEQRFWRMLMIAGVLLGIAVVGERDLLGVAHLTLLSLQAIGMTMLSAIIPWQKRHLAILVLVGCAVDFSTGVLLQARVESLENNPQGTVFPGTVFEDGKIQTALPGPDALSHSSWNNWFIKHQLAVYYWWLNDLNQHYGQDPAFQKMLPDYQQKIDQERKDDKEVWQGWFSHHGGEVVFLGDHTAAASSAGINIATAALLLLFVGLAGRVYVRPA